MHISRTQTGTQEAQLTLTDEGKIEEEDTSFTGETLAAHYEVWLPGVGKEVILSSRDEILDNIRERCQEYIDTGEMEEMPEELQ